MQRVTITLYQLIGLKIIMPREIQASSNLCRNIKNKFKVARNYLMYVKLKEKLRNFYYEVIRKKITLKQKEIFRKD